MKKTFGIICAIIMVTMPSWGVRMCRRDTTYVAILDAETNGTVETTDITSHTFFIDMPYETSTAVKYKTKVTGQSLCNAVTKPVNGLVNTGVAVSDNPDNNVGVNCWCKMEMPATSYWTYLQQYSSDLECESQCTTNCANAIATNEIFRDAIYHAIW